VEKRQLISHAEAKRLLLRAGYSRERIEELLRHLPDPIDADRDADVLFKLGLSRGSLMDRMGGSP
jgi:hypothetical protein